MKTKKEKLNSFRKEINKLRKEGLLREERQPFLELLKKAIKPQSSSR